MGGQVGRADGLGPQSGGLPQHSHRGVCPGGTFFSSVNDGPEAALEQARDSAAGRDVRIAGGADVIQQYMNLGVINELEISLAPVLFGGGRRLFANLSEPPPRFRIERVLDRPAATHLRYVRAWPAA